jgi:hypothetical protein
LHVYGVCRRSMSRWSGTPTVIFQVIFIINLGIMIFQVSARMRGNENYLVSNLTLFFYKFNLKWTWIWQTFYFPSRVVCSLWCPSSGRRWSGSWLVCCCFCFEVGEVYHVFDNSGVSIPTYFLSILLVSIVNIFFINK